MRFVWFALVFLSVAGIAAGSKADDDEIKDLPGLSFKPNFKHYSGYLQASDTRYLHYWFVESQHKPEKDPLIFWYNGGPGCSSLDGLLKEMGPYVVAEDGKTLVENPYAWNQFASIVYVEAPAGVGFSYATDRNIDSNDDQTATENYNAVVEFFKRFPDYRKHRTFIAGESYGGVYIPTLVSKILDGQNDFKIKLKGMLIGNGYVNAELNTNTMIEFAYLHGLIDEEHWKELTSKCCNGCDANGCNFAKNCKDYAYGEFARLWGLLNPYDLYRDCEASDELRRSAKWSAIGRGVTPAHVHHLLFAAVNTSAPTKSRLAKRSQISEKTYVPCLNSTDITSYLNRDDVRVALHVPKDVGSWEICSDDVAWHYDRSVEDTSPYVKQAHKAGVRTLLYYGDTDMACNFLLGQRFADSLGIEMKSEKTAWNYGGQVGGFKTTYAGRLVFTTIRGSGHMAPQWRAPQTQYAVRQFVNNKNI